MLPFESDEKVGAFAPTGSAENIQIWCELFVSVCHSFTFLVLIQQVPISAKIV